MKKDNLKNLIIILTLLVASCSADKNYKQDDRLIAASSEFIMEDGEHATPYYMNHENFIEPYFSVDYKTDTLSVTTIKEVNCCGETVADIKTSNDTLYLMTRHISDEACTCVEFRKYTYTIHNKDNKKFIIKSEK